MPQAALGRLQPTQFEVSVKFKAVSMPQAALGRLQHRWISARYDFRWVSMPQAALGRLQQHLCVTQGGNCCFDAASGIRSVATSLPAT